MHRCSQYNILNLSVAKSFQNFDNILRDWAKDEVPKSLEEAVNRYEKQKVEVFSLKKGLRNTRAISSVGSRDDKAKHKLVNEITSR